MPEFLLTVYNKTFRNELRAVLYRGIYRFWKTLANHLDINYISLQLQYFELNNLYKSYVI